MFASKIAARGHSKAGAAAQGTAAARWSVGARSDEALSDTTMLEGTPRGLSWGFGKASAQENWWWERPTTRPEREADTVADRVIWVPDPVPAASALSTGCGLQRK